LPWKNLSFSYQILSKKVVFLVSNGKNTIVIFAPPPEKSFASLEKTTIARPG